MKTIFEILKTAVKKLESAEIENPRLDSEILLAYVLNCRRLKLYTDSEKILTDEEISRFENLIERRAEKNPVAYLIGTKEFMGFNFVVTPDVLIPRPDTEILTQCAIDFFQNNGGKNFLDIGTGSGAICISILKFCKNISACAVDISKKSLEVAEFNAGKFGVDDRVNFFCGNLFEPVEGKIFDAVISNPPYIPTNDLENLQDEVKREPKTALDGGADGLDFYRKIIHDAPKFLSDGGLLAFEIGINQAEEVKKIFEENNFCNIEILKDLAGIERVIFARRFLNEN